jgi:hypothetical protein
MCKTGRCKYEDQEGYCNWDWYDINNKPEDGLCECEIEGYNKALEFLQKEFELTN